jgi:hypothetical protein
MFSVLGSRFSVFHATVEAVPERDPNHRGHREAQRFTEKSREEGGGGGNLRVA